MMDGATHIEFLCQRSVGGSVRDCQCFLPNEQGFLECPPETRRPLAKRQAAPPARTGDICATCGGANLVRAGTCLLCRDCGDTSGGCS